VVYLNELAMAQTDIPNATEKIQERSTDVPWFYQSIGDKLGPSPREVLEHYSKIPADEVEAHVYKIVCHMFAAICLSRQL